MQPKFKLPRLYPILDTEALGRRGFEPETIAEVLLDMGVGILQYRHKGLFTQARYDEVARIAGRCRSAGALFVMNDRADVAVSLQTGLHIGQNDLPPAAARNLLGANLVMGFSTHNERQLSEADELPADYLAFGPIFNTGSKLNPDPVVGIAELRRIRSRTRKPLVAIGGITPGKAKEVLEGGADSVATISGLMPEKGGDLAALRAHTEVWMKAVGERC